MGDDYANKSRQAGKQAATCVTRLLLDFPWDLDAILQDDAAPSFALQQFVDLIRRTGLAPVPFIEQGEEAALWQKIEQFHAGADAWAALMPFLHECRREAAGTCEAKPAEPEPSCLRPSWKCALRDELVDRRSWRNPQIIVTKDRHPDWRRQEEVDLYCLKCGDQEASGPHRRVVAVLEDYDAHRFASADLDPWDLRRLYPPKPDAARQHLCRLPKPPMRQPVGLDLLYDEIVLACRNGCRLSGGRYFYIPDPGWRLDDIDSHEWREGRAFPRRKSPERDQMGYLDYEDHIWVWDRHEQHWDVQWGGKNNYITVNQEGKILKCPDHLRRKIAW